jgi:hypothetical protein
MPRREDDSRSNAPEGVRSVRVAYTVAARDAVDGPRPATCTPRSGSLFKVGQTKVTCTATDRSGNTAKKTFTITVKRA